MTIIRARAATSVKLSPELVHFLSKCEDLKLKQNVDNTLTLLKQDYLLGVKIPRYLWPRYYEQRWGITNLYKTNLGRKWRLTYTLVSEGAGISIVALELLSHKDYDKRFGYKTS